MHSELQNKVWNIECSETVLGGEPRGDSADLVRVLGTDHLDTLTARARLPLDRTGQRGANPVARLRHHLPCHA